MGNLIISYNLAYGEKLRVGYRLSGSGSSFTYLPKMLSWNDSPYTITNLPDGQYDVELTAFTNDCRNSPCSQPLVYTTSSTASSPTLSVTVQLQTDPVTGKTFFKALLSSDYPLNSDLVLTIKIQIKDSNNTLYSENYTLQMQMGDMSLSQILRQSNPGETIVSYCLVSNYSAMPVNISLSSC